jgi:hypothetical protein
MVLRFPQKGMDAVPVEDRIHLFDPLDVEMRAVLLV